MKNVKIKIVHEMAKLPVYSSPEAAGADLVACINEPVTISHGQITPIPTGIKLALEDCDTPYCYLLCGRSGLGGKHGITLANSIGIVDSDYRGELVACLINNSNEDYVVSPGERIAQLVLVPIEKMVFTIVDVLPETQRGTGGFGSTGK